ncbi:reverse transcriptase domain-containing protein [Tanacetum coccineum]|uniref:Reverse transcriptase domain-containing protein n=1 Tax=Tanacetum coccineum TaxID=301880 RepID=A0ABQ4XRQ3_9ASTR
MKYEFISFGKCSNNFTSISLLLIALVSNFGIQKMLKALFSNKEKLLELANTPLNGNCSLVILKKLPEKLGDPRKFLIPCSFSELNCKALADLGASINLMPLSVWKKLGLSELISTRMTLELANRSVCIPAGIARDVFVPVGRFTFPANFVIVDYESDPRVPLILGRPFLRTARALIDVHGEELILRDGDERLILNMKHGTSIKDDIFDPEGDNVLIEKLLNLDSTKDLPPNVNLLSGSTTSSYPSLTTSEISDYSLKEFADELVLIESFPSGNDKLDSEDFLPHLTSSGDSVLLCGFFRGKSKGVESSRSVVPDTSLCGVYKRPGSLSRRGWDVPRRKSATWDGSRPSNSYFLGGKRINSIDADKDITLVIDQDDADVFDVNTLTGCMSKSNVVEEPSVPVSVASTKDSAATTTTTPRKGIVITVQCFNEEIVSKLQAEFDEDERLAREKDEANVALTKEWVDIQAKVDVDY